MKKKVDEFDTVSEDGRKYHITVYKTMVDMKSISDPHAEPIQSELREAVTAEGYKCNYISNDELEVLDLMGPVRVKLIKE